MSRPRRIACEEIAREAGALLKARFGTPGEVRGKGVSDSGRIYDVVTEVDFLSERLVLDRIAQLDPDAVVLAEEGGLVHADGRADEIGSGVDEYAQRDAELWFVDPLDGTVNFAHGIPHFCVSIAVWRGGEPVAGAVFDPMVGELFSFEWDDPAAGTERASYFNGELTKLPGDVPASDSMVYIGGSGNVKLLPAIRKFRSWRRLGSAALALSWVGVGRCGAYLQPAHLNAWDWGAGAPFVLAAGGALALPHGDDWRVQPSSTIGIIASTPLVGAEIRPIVAEALAD